MKKIQKASLNQGFTLIELMAAMAITMIIVLILATVTKVSLTTYQQSRSELRAERQAKAMLEVMGRDLEAIIIRKGGLEEWLSVDATQAPESKFNKSVSSSNFYFFTAATDRYDGKSKPQDGNKGDISAVAYRLAFKDPISNELGANFPSFIFYRQLANPDSTFEKVLGKSDVKQAFDSLYSQEKIEDSKNYVCENIFQYTVTFMIEVRKKKEDSVEVFNIPVVIASSDMSSVTDRFNVTGQGIDIGKAKTNQVSAEDIKNGRIKAISISTTVLSEAAVIRLRSQRMDAKTLEDYLLKNTREYSRFIPISYNL